MKKKHSIKKENLKYLHAMNAVVRIHVKGTPDNNLNAILDPRLIERGDWVGSGFFIRSTLHRSLIPIYSNYYNESKSESKGAVFVSSTNTHDFA